MSWPTISWARSPVAPAALMRRVDAQASQRFGIEPRQLMEIAGFQVARFVADWTGGVIGKRVAVVAGAGNNGGDALVAARFLAQQGAQVTAWIVEARDPGSLAAARLLTTRAMQIPCFGATDPFDDSADVILDGVLGTGIRLPLRDPAPRLIAAINAATGTVIAIDVPSGLDSDSGAGDADAVQAEATVTLGLPKPALAWARSCGRVFLADIGLPPALFEADREAVATLYGLGSLLELERPAQTSS